MAGIDKRLARRTTVGVVARTYPEDFTMEMDSKTYAAYEETISRLCEYEETGLTPAEIAELKQRVADAEPIKHGEWEQVEKVNMWGDTIKVFQCSCCECFTNGSVGIIRTSNYCPNCGARMDGDKK